MYIERFAVLDPLCGQGGDPLDFKHGNAASVSVQSTSFTDQHPDQFPTRYFE